MFISFSAPTYVQVVRFQSKGNKVEKKIEKFTLLPEDKLELPYSVISLVVKEPNLPAFSIKIKSTKSTLDYLYKDLEEKCLILGTTLEDYIKQKKQSLF